MLCTIKIVSQCDCRIKARRKIRLGAHSQLYPTTVANASEMVLKKHCCVDFIYYCLYTAATKTKCTFWHGASAVDGIQWKIQSQDLHRQIIHWIRSTLQTEKRFLGKAKRYWKSINITYGVVMRFLALKWDASNCILQTNVQAYSVKMPSYTQKSLHRIRSWIH